MRASQLLWGLAILRNTFRILVSRSDIDLRRMDTDSFNSLVDIRLSALRPNGMDSMPFDVHVALNPTRWR